MRVCLFFVMIGCLMSFGSAGGGEPIKQKRSVQFDPEQQHQMLVRTARPRLQFRSDSDFERWQPELRQELKAVLGLPAMTAAPLDVTITKQESTDLYDRYRVVFQSEFGADVPCYLLKPKRNAGADQRPWPVMICLQGHKKVEGMKVSVGDVPDGGGRDIAIQAVKHGWAALAVEQRSFGERRGDCKRQSLDAMMLGRTLTGERVFDVQRAIDFIETQPDLDDARIGCMGNSTGGTVTFYAACVDERIRIAIVSCSYCTYAESWMKIPHCACGYLPGILRIADMGDLAGLVAPRKLLIVAGDEDYLATIQGVRTAFAQTVKIYRAAGCGSQAELLVGHGGHQFYPELAWPRIQASLMDWE